MNESLASGDSDFGVIGDVPTVSAIAAGQENEVVAVSAQAADSYAVLVAADLSLEPEQVVAILPKYNYSVLPQQEDIDALNDTISFLVGIDAISESYDIGDYVNSSYAESDRVQAYLK